MKLDITNDPRHNEMVSNLDNFLSKGGKLERNKENSPKDNSKSKGD